MNRFEVMGVFLKGSPADDAVLAFAAQMAHLGVGKIECIHVRDAAPGASEEMPDLDALRAKVREVLTPELTDQVTCEIREGYNLVEVLKAARDREMGLIVVGRRLPSSQMGIGSKMTRIVRKSPCSVLVVPEMCKPHFGRILVAVDRSEHARLSLEAAVALARASSDEKAQLETITVRSVDPKHDLAGVTFAEAAEAQRNHARRDLDKFLATVDTKGVHIESTIVLSDGPAKAITHVAMAKKMDILVMGSRGATRPTAILLGSKSEEILMSCAMPILIIKKKGETLRLLEALFDMDSNT